MTAAEQRGGSSEPAPRQGLVAPRIAAELPGLGIASIEVEGGARRSPEPVRERLRYLSDRFYGSHAVHLRERPIPWAYRVFFRHIGLDPDAKRTPVEELAVQRLQDGAFRSRGLPGDALAIAIAETGVALVALDAASIRGSLCIRDSGPGESPRGAAGALAPATLVVADERGPIAPLFDDVPAAYAVGPATRRTTIAAVQVSGVPQIAVEEALWLAAGVLAAP